jgi:hypothetical protein
MASINSYTYVHNHEHRVHIVKQKPIQGGCMVLALVERERKVSFGEACRALQSNGGQNLCGMMHEVNKS